MPNFLTKLLSIGSDRELKEFERITGRVNDLESRFEAMSEEELRGCTAAFRERYDQGESLDDLLPEAFAAGREASRRTTGLRQFDVQIIGGIALHRGTIAEMKTGEGKTLVSTLAGYLNAIPGKGVHIVTVNDYLARRDSEWMGQIYRYLGMSVGLLQNGMRLNLKKPAYAADVTYGTNSEFGFDYLRDNMVTRPGMRVQRGHHYAIVDEADSILIDEARTPLIISGAGTKSASTYKDFARAVRGLIPDVDFTMDEAKHTIATTDDGLKKVERALGVDDIYADVSGQLVNHLQQALKAEYMFHRDQQYVVVDGEVKIVDEFTGRIMEGRRYSEGLHQAIEAKEGVIVREENQTLATITLQNYFLMYDKLSGMTGTAMTEDAEFREVYHIPVQVIPPNRPVIRKDHDDLVYRTVEAKFKAVADDVAERHANGQPCLVGTVSIENSEKLSRILDKRGIKHNVLNAKYHEREAQIVAQAGREGAVTIATNMAGRGTDILLGGNPDELAEEAVLALDFDVEQDVVKRVLAAGDPRRLTVEGLAKQGIEIEREVLLAISEEYEKALKAAKERCEVEKEHVRAAGGLCVIGTERHESRRIDNQLRGRSGRQGDPGETRFYISLEDDLMRLFGGDRVTGMMERMNIDEDTPIENKMLSRAIEQAQTTVESRNFQARKSVLEYDDVMNKQREIIYGQRKQVLDGMDVKGIIMGMMESAIGHQVRSAFMGQEHLDMVQCKELLRGLEGVYFTKYTVKIDESQLPTLTEDDFIDMFTKAAADFYEKKEQEITPPVMRELERVVLLRVVDEYWMDHIDAMQDLRQGIRLRAYAQTNPVDAYKKESLELFEEMIDAMMEETVRRLYSVRLRQNEEVKRERVASGMTENVGGDGTVKKRPTKVVKVGRNDLCPCGSGLKWKKCTCKEYHS